MDFANFLVIILLHISVGVIEIFRSASLILICKVEHAVVERVSSGIRNILQLVAVIRQSQVVNHPIGGR